MGDLEVIRDVYAFNSRVRKGYLRAIWRLPTKERYRDRGASYPSLVDIFLHVLDAYRWWFRTVYGRETNVPEFPLGIRMSRARARREEAEVDRMVSGILRKLTERDLARRVTIPRTRERLPLRTVLLHMMEEELQHRGEMNALLWQAGKDPPVVGYDDAWGRR